MAFFKELGDKISSAGEIAIAKAQDFSTTVTIRTKISEEEKTINATYAKIGALYYQLHSNDFENEFAGMFQVVNNCNKRIEDYKAQLDSMKDMDHCEKCGAEIPKSDFFCPMCGARKSGEVNDPDSVLCPKCQSPVKAGLKFCTSCGAKME